MTSPVPGTTLNLLKFPVTRPEPHFVNDRSRRLNQFKSAYIEEEKGKIFLHKGVCTGCPDLIVRSVNLTLLPNQKTCRKCKDSSKIVRKKATKHAFG